MQVSTYEYLIRYILKNKLIISAKNYILQQKTGQNILMRFDYAH